MKKLVALVTGLFMTMGLLVGCGSSGGPVSYAPVAYGQQVGGVFQCYWVQDPSEVLDPQMGLIAQGNCPPGSVPVHMPDPWYQTYFAYYSSPAYYNSYMPVRYRTVYISYETHYYSSHRSQVDSAESKAQYRGSNGKTVTNPKVNPGQFSGGSGKGSKFSGGSGKSGGSSGGSSSRSGGSRSGGSTGRSFSGGGGKR